MEFSSPDRAFHCTVNIPLFTLSYALRILLSSDSVKSSRASIFLIHSISFAYARAIFGELSSCSIISKSASFATGDCTFSFTPASCFVIPWYISSDCLINVSASSSLLLPASHFSNRYVASSFPVIFSIFALCVGVNPRLLATTFFGMFLVTVSTHGVLIADISRAIDFLAH